MTFIAIIFIGLLGLFAHWVKKWCRGQTSAGFIEYMRGERKHTIASLSALSSAIAGIYVVGDVVLTGQVAATAFLAGYSIDSALNKAPDEK